MLIAMVMQESVHEGKASKYSRTICKRCGSGKIIIISSHTIAVYNTSAGNGDLDVEVGLMSALAQGPFIHRDDESTFPALVLYAILYTGLSKV